MGNKKKTEIPPLIQCFAGIAHELSKCMTYREYLSLLYSHAKQHIKPYSYLKFAEELNLGTNNNVMRVVLKQDRKLTKKMATMIADALQLKGNTRKYWLVLVEANTTEDNKLQNQLFKKLLTLRSRLLPDSIDPLKSEYFQEWYHCVICALAARDDFEMDPKWIQKKLRFSVRAEDIRSSLELLTKLGLIYYDAQKNGYTSSNVSIDTGPNASGIAYIQYHQQMIEIAQQSITKVQKSDRDISGTTISLSKTSFEKLKKKVHQLVDESIQLEDDEPKEQSVDVVQLNVQLFPLTKD